MLAKSPFQLIHSIVLLVSAAFCVGDRSPAQIMIDFELAGPCSFTDALPLGVEYINDGVEFVGPVFNGGGCVLDDCANFGVSARSGTHFLAFSSFGVTSNGGATMGPVELRFAGVLNSVSIYGSGGTGGGATFEMHAYLGDSLVGTSTQSVIGGDNYVRIPFSSGTTGFNRVIVNEITGKSAWVLDDLEFDGDRDPLGAFCFGNAAGNTCPCGNIGIGATGCANSSSFGAKLTGSGTLSLAADDLEFSGDNLLPGQAALLFSGTLESNGGNGSLLGDGLLCVAGSIQRLGVRIPNAAGKASWGSGSASLLGWGVGESRTFQVWYRDTVGIPCGGGFNLTNGLRGVFLP